MDLLQQPREQPFWENFRCRCCSGVCQLGSTSRQKSLQSPLPLLALERRPSIFITGAGMLQHEVGWLVACLYILPERSQFESSDKRARLVSLLLLLLSRRYSNARESERKLSWKIREQAAADGERSAAGCLLFT